MSAVNAPAMVAPGARRPVGLVDWVFRGLASAVVVAWISLLVSLIRSPTAGGLLGLDLATRLLGGIIIAPSMMLVSTTILWRAPGHVIGRLLTLLAVGMVVVQFDLDLLPPELNTTAKLLIALYLMGVCPAAFCTLLLTLPSGQVYPDALNPFVPLYWTVRIAGTALDFAASPGNFYGVVLFNPPSGLVPALVPFHPLVAWTVGAIGPTIPLGVGAGVLSLRQRFGASTAGQRQQIKWIVWALGLATLALAFRMVSVLSGVTHAAPQLAETTIVVAWLVFEVVIAALGISILRYNLFDVDLVIRRTVVYGTLTACIVGIYVGIVGTLGALFHASGNLAVSLLATGVVAVVVQPLRERLQRAASRLLYGERDDPYPVLQRLGQRLAAALAPEAVLPTIVETIAQALKLPYVAIALRRDNAFDVVAASGSEPSGAATPVILPLIFQGETLGQLILSRRSPDEDLSRADQRLLVDLARQAGIAAHTVRLTVDLQRSRQQLVTAREEERRRLRRDLHDGLGPVLASLTLKLDAARNLLGRDPARTAELLVELKGQTQGAVADIRRLVYDLRPPALDDLGLVAAIREHTAPLAVGLTIVVEAPDALPALSAAVEVAAYRIALEAVTNVVRHAAARHCVVRLAVNGDLCLEVSDDGRGFTRAMPRGVGLTSMRERAEELGGALTIDTVPTGGTRVIAHLPR